MVYFVNTEDSFNFKNKKLNMLEKIRCRLVYNRQNKLNRQGTALKEAVSLAVVLFFCI